MLGRQWLQRTMLCCAAVVLLFAGLAPSAQAADKVWNSAFARGSWSVASNGVGDIAPTAC
ncbi:MAG: hypothetical protein EAZ43_11270 [Betaproteobacteria bacterium]|nr:MAG: hypothetical protein EAZ43_11270 [Betaproteobacteria bacterium]